MVEVVVFLKELYLHLLFSQSFRINQFDGKVTINWLDLRTFLAKYSLLVFLR